MGRHVDTQTHPIQSTHCCSLPLIPSYPAGSYRHCYHKANNSRRHCLIRVSKTKTLAFVIAFIFDRSLKSLQRHQLLNVRTKKGEMKLYLENERKNCSMMHNGNTENRPHRPQVTTTNYPFVEYAEEARMNSRVLCDCLNRACVMDL